MRGMACKKFAALLLSLLLAISLFPAAAFADSGPTLTLYDAYDITPYGADLYAQISIPETDSTEYGLAIQYCTNQNFQYSSDISMPHAVKQDSINCAVSSLLPDTIYYYRAVAYIGSISNISSTSEVKTFHTLVLTSEQTLEPGVQVSSEFTAGQTKYFKFVPNQPCEAKVEFSSDVPVGTETFSFSQEKSRINYANQNPIMLSLQVLYEGDNYLGITAADAGTYNFTISYIDLPTIHIGDNAMSYADNSSNCWLFTAPDDGCYTFTSAEQYFAYLFSATGSLYQSDDDNSITAELSKGEQVVIEPKSPSNISITKTDLVKNVRIASAYETEPSPSESIDINMETYSESYRFFWGTGKIFSELIPSSITINADDGLKVSQSAADVNSGTFSIRATDFGTYTLNVSGKDAEGNYHSGAINVTVSIPRVGFSTSPDYSEESWIENDNYSFTGTGTVYFYDAYDSVNGDMSDYSMKLSTGNNMMDYPSQVVTNSRGEKVLKAVIDSTENPVGTIYVKSSYGSTRELSFGVRADIGIFTDEACTQRFSGTLALGDTQTSLYFKSLGDDTLIWVIPDDGLCNYNTQQLADGVVCVKLWSNQSFSSPKTMNVWANFDGGKSQLITINITSSSLLNLETVNTGSVGQTAYVSSDYNNGTTFDLRALSNGAETDNFTIKDYGDSSIASVAKVGSLIKIGYVGPGTTYIEVENGSVGQSFEIICCKRVEESQWEKDAKSELLGGGNINLQLSGDIELSSQLDVMDLNSTGDNAVLDLNGYSLIYYGDESALSVKGGNTLTITDSSADKTGRIISVGDGECLSVEGYDLGSGNVQYGKCTLDVGTLTGKQPVWVKQFGELDMNGGAVIGSSDLYSVGNWGKITMTGGTIYNRITASVYCLRDSDDGTSESDSGFFEMKTGSGDEPTVSGGSMAISSANGKLVIGAGTVKADIIDGAAVMSTGSVTLTGGTLVGGTGVQLKSDESCTGTLSATGGKIIAGTAVKVPEGGTSPTMSKVTILPAVAKPAGSLSITVSEGKAHVSTESDYTCLSSKMVLVSYSSTGRMLSMQTADNGVSAGKWNQSFTLPVGTAAVKALLLSPDMLSPWFASAALSVK